MKVLWTFNAGWKKRGLWKVSAKPDGILSVV